ncbi:TonB-dependent receptor domain-containing protein [Rodentibacter myodis]|uniref:TonB-dependent receptor n=1 Tax=Rodentibacter myodis TaxID=1907939 RepID=A0A1V3JKK7_9PAST|nr:TonB-dependent receptor [Rodentibacter myodis]OOF57340.1 TonB-dependent receptor [Rodentibacter myodis]
MKRTKFALLPLAVFVTFNVQANAEQLDVIDVVSDNYSPQVSNVAAKGVVKVRQATKVSDVLRGVPGVNVNGSRSVVERYNIRGVSEEYLTVSIDGARQEGYSFHHSGNYGIDPEILKRVDIDVGANSVTTAAGSLGGSVKFETVDAEDMLEKGQNFGGKVKYGWGSNGNSHQSTAMLYGRVRDLDLLGYFNYRHQENGKDGNGLKNQNEGHLQNYLFKGTYHISPEQWVKFSAERYHNTALSCFRANFGMCLGDVPQPGEKGFINKNHGRAYTGIERKTYTLSYGYKPTDNGLIDMKANIYNTETENSSMTRKQSKVRTLGGTLSNRANFDFGETNHNVLIGGEYYQTKAMRFGGVDTNRRTGAVTGIRPDYTQKAYNTSVYLEDAIALGDFVVTPGIRYDHYKADFIGFNKSYNRFSKALGLKYFVGENLVLFGNYTELFRGPGFGELTLVSPGRYQGSLEATKGDNKELGFNYAKENLLSSDDTFSITAKYFHTDYDNVTQSVEGIGKSTYENLGRVLVNGVEASAKYRINNLTTSVSYARARSEQKDNHHYTAFPDSGDRYVFGLNYYIPSTQIDLGWNTMYVRDFYTNAATSTRKEGYAVSNAYISWSPTQVKGLELTFGVDNIFNKAYKDHSTQYYNAVDLDPGRNYKLSASYKF